MCRRFSYFGIIVIFFICKAAWTFYWDTEATVFAPDSYVYFTIASHLAQNGIFTYDGVRPTAQREPLYPILLAGLMICGIGHPYTATVHQVFPIILVQALMYLLSLWFIGEITHAYFRDVVAGLTILFLGIYQEISLYWMMILSETSYIFCLSAFMFFFWKWDRTKARKRFLCLSGIFLGLACVIKSVTVLFPFCIFILVFMRLESKRFLTASLFLMCSLVFMLLWGGRNYVQFGHYYVTTTEGGSSLYRGNLYLYELIPNLNHPRIPHDLQRRLEGMNEVEKDRFLRTQGFKLFLDTPVKIAAKLCYKLGRLLFGADSRLVSLFKLLFLICIIFRSRTYVRTGNVYFMVSACYAVYIMCLYMLVYTTPRYFIPALFLLAPFFVEAVCTWMNIIYPLVRKGLPK